MAIRLLDTLKSPWGQGSNWSVEALSLSQIAQTPQYVSEGFENSPSRPKDYRVLSIRTQSSETIEESYAERVFEKPQDLTNDQDIRFWLRCDRIGIANSETTPLFLLFEAFNDDKDLSWGRLLPVKQPNKWELHCLWLEDMDDQLRKEITRFRLSSLVPRLSLTIAMGDLVATIPNSIDDVHHNLVDQLTAATSGVITDKETGKIIDVKIFTELPEAKQAKSQMPCVVITFWSVKSMQERGGSVDVIDNYVPPPPQVDKDEPRNEPQAAYMRSVPWWTQLEFAIDVYAQKPGQKNSLLAAIIGNVNQQPYLRINAMPLRIFPFTPAPEESASLVSPGRSPLFYRITIPIERGDRRRYPYSPLGINVNAIDKQQDSYVQGPKTDSEPVIA